MFTFPRGSAAAGAALRTLGSGGAGRRASGCGRRYAVGLAAFLLEFCG